VSNIETIREVNTDDIIRNCIASVEKQSWTVFYQIFTKEGEFSVRVKWK
jgi:hypothetical protein